MSTKVLVVAPHPDDETLGCGGTLLRHVARGDSVSWLIVTSMTPEHGFGADRIARRAEEIKAVACAYPFDAVHNLELPPAGLDQVSARQLVQAIADVVHATLPSTIYVPFPGDIHTDHRAVFGAAVSAVKWFRQPSVRRLLCYETLSETDLAMNPGANGFSPNVFVDISDHLDRKLEIARLYEGEIGAFPFPRSEAAIQALARTRGAASGCAAAESFVLLREILRD